ncbi:PEP/pyruvate-binding domain-containing protein [Streptomyces boninensis]|uniref:PEP/pyruvate-binding domain-containing protein n=1 Tax=Streptomyces boninensis TaxID=2039455 RepID=UPI003B21EC35
MAFDFDVEADRLAVVALDDPRARDARLAGAKAANLARAAGAGLPVLPGFVLLPDGQAGDVRDLRAAWAELSDGGARPLIVRSSSAYEDAADSSMAGWYESVLDVRGWEGFTAAVAAVLDSARRVLLPPPGGGLRRARPGGGMAVLVQPMLEAVAGGVMFGVDPVAGRDDRILVSAVRGGPARLVDGSAQGGRYQLSRTGRLLGVAPAEPRGRRLLSARRRRQLAALARRAERVFGGPQDIEFGYDTDDRLWLFQARPITAVGARPPRGARLLGPGPVAETFPGVLQPLEEDLWLTPMSHGLATALGLAGAAPRRLLRRGSVVTTVDGRAVADLRLIGAAPPRHRVLHFLNPVPPARRAGAAWQLGRLRAALPLLALDLLADVDRQLASFPTPADMLGGPLLDAVAWGRTTLSALHAQESLAGVLLGEGGGATAAGEALSVLGEMRAEMRAGVVSGVAHAVDAPVAGGGGASASRVEGAGSRAGGASASRGGGAYARGGDVPASRAADVAAPQAGDRSAPRANGAPAPGAEPPDDAALIAAHPVLLALLPPTLADRPPLPRRQGWTGVARGVGRLPVREGLRLRIRWVQEMQAAMVREVAGRMHAAGQLDDPERIALLRWAEIKAAADGKGLPTDLPERLPRREGAALPAAFRLAGTAIVAEPAGGGGAGRRGGSGSGRGRNAGQGAGGGYGTGVAWDGAGARPERAVLVVRTLDPSLAPELPGLAGLVAETGSVLSHLAVLAREYGVPTAVGVPAAVERFPAGTALAVDGGTGAVDRQDDAAQAVGGGVSATGSHAPAVGDAIPAAGSHAPAAGDATPTTGSHAPAAGDATPTTGGDGREGAAA